MKVLTTLPEAPPYVGLKGKCECCFTEVELEEGDRVFPSYVDGKFSHFFLACPITGTCHYAIRFYPREDSNVNQSN